MSDQALYMILIAFTILMFLPVSRTKHWYYISQSKKRLKVLKTIDHPAKKMAYLKKMNPYVFEEMILTSLKQGGHRITRSPAYSGDGGIDGKAVINGQKVLIQAKCYTNHINLKHVHTFSEICQKKRKLGLFVHCGKTSKSLMQQSVDNVKIISGQRLLDLFEDGKVSVL